MKDSVACAFAYVRISDDDDDDARVFCRSEPTDISLSDGVGKIDSARIEHATTHQLRYDNILRLGF